VISCFFIECLQYTRISELHAECVEWSRTGSVKSTILSPYRFTRHHKSNPRQVFKKNNTAYLFVSDKRCHATGTAPRLYQYCAILSIYSTTTAPRTSTYTDEGVVVARGRSSAAAATITCGFASAIVAAEPGTLLVGLRHHGVRVECRAIAATASFGKPIAIPRSIGKLEVVIIRSTTCTRHVASESIASSGLGSGNTSHAATVGLAVVVPFVKLD
jgi:hypothetical protein